MMQDFNDELQGMQQQMAFMMGGKGKGNGKDGPYGTPQIAQELALG